MSDENSFPHESLKSGSSSSVMFCPLPEKEEPAQTKTDAAGAGRQIARAAGIVMAVYLLSNLIGLGFALLLAQVANLAMGGTLVAIVINAYIGTGLSMALLVFYRSRVIKGEPEIA